MGFGWTTNVPHRLRLSVRIFKLGVTMLYRRLAAYIQVLCILLSFHLSTGLAQLHPSEPATYRRLPSLREQALILDGWRDERLANVPSLLARNNVDVWLVR